MLPEDVVVGDRGDEDLEQAVVVAALLHREQRAAIGLRVDALKILFFTLLAACTVAALQTVGALLVIAMVVTPGATAYLLTDRFDRLLLVSMAIGSSTSLLGAYLSYFVDGATGGVIVSLQTLVFLAAFVLAPKHGLLATRRDSHRSGEGAP